MFLRKRFWVCFFVSAASVSCGDGGTGKPEGLDSGITVKKDSGITQKKDSGTGTVDGGDPSEDTCVHVAVKKNCKDGFCLIPAGCFIGGSKLGEPGSSPNEPLTEVTLTRDFYIGQTEVTQKQWEAAGFHNPSGSGLLVEGDTICKDPNCPVYNISWFEAVAFANKMSKTHKPPLEECYKLHGCTGEVGKNFVCTGVDVTKKTVYDCNGFRLPTHAEWEYATRAGTTTAFYSGPMLADPKGCPPDANLDKIAWYCGNSTGPHPVAKKQPNNWGLYDPLGNAYEWISDQHTGLGYRGWPITDPVDPFDDSYMKTERDARGGHAGQLGLSSTCNPYYTYPEGWQYKVSYLGMRLARSVKGSEGGSGGGGEVDGGVAAGVKWKVPPTNQNKCYNESTTIPCDNFPCNADGGPDFCGQDAQYAKLSKIKRSFKTTSGSDGNVLVSDSVTGLMWEQEFTYNVTSQGAIDYCNSLDYSGYNDWRLPSVTELVTISDMDAFAPGIDQTAFPDTPDSEQFWSSSRYSGVGDLWWTLNFWFISVNRIDTKRKFCARCVRGEPLKTGAYNPFVVDSQRVVKDLGTDLEWQGCSAGQSGDTCNTGTATKMTWKEAPAYCESLTWAGHSDWRLPNAFELQSIVDYNKEDPSIDSTAFPHTPSDWFWSSSTQAPSSQTATKMTSVACVYFYYGNVNGHNQMNYCKKTASIHTRCVRNGLK